VGKAGGGGEGREDETNNTQEYQRIWEGDQGCAKGPSSGNEAVEGSKEKIQMGEGKGRSTAIGS